MLVIYCSRLYIADVFSFQDVDDFVFELSMRETNAEKRRKIGDLTLTDDEWDRVRLFCNLLQVCSTINFVLSLLIFISQHADDAQQAFSSGSRPSLHNALPAIETLYAAWQSASKKPRYAPFVPALEAAMEKLNEYYKRTAESDAHIITMGSSSHIYSYLMFTLLHLALDPQKKFSHFKKNWDV